MAKMSEEVKAAIKEYRPGIIASANKAGKPNVSPAGSTHVIDDEHVAFANVASPTTVANLKENPQVAVICINPTQRKGCRVWGRAEIVTSGELFDKMTQQMAALKMKVINVVKITVEDSRTFAM